MKWDGRIVANALHIPLADECVQMCVTSPPYYGLRSYAIEPTVWGGNPDCEHQWLDGDLDECLFCDAWRGVLGMETSVEMYLEHIVMVFREVRRVLRKDGVCFMNLGDSYAQSGGRGFQGSTSQRLGRKNVQSQVRPEQRNPPPGFKAKDLMMIPHRTAIALQDDGWWVRNDIVWEKAQCMPESTRDRCTRSHEYVFHLTKRADYYWDAEAIKEPASADSHARYSRRRSQMEEYSHETFRYNGMNRPRAAGVNPKAQAQRSGIKSNESFSAAVKDVVAMRNKRTVWKMAIAGYPEAHFATFTPELPEICILAGTSAYGCCSACGAPYERELEPSADYAKYLGKSYHDHEADTAEGMMQNRGTNNQNKMRDETGQHCAEYVTKGWKPGCSCAAAVVPCTVLDIFVGSGTTAMVAEQLNRRWIGLDLGYQDLQKKRLQNVQKELAL